MKVFISSTFTDLIPYRTTTIQSLHRMGEEVGGMEVIGARPDEPLRFCRAEVEECDLFVGIYAHRYGFIPKGSDISITEDELRHAVVHGKPVFCFVVDDEHPWNPRWIEDEPGKGKLHKLRNFIHHQYGIERFTTPDDLACRVVTAVSRHLQRRLKAPEEEKCLLQTILNSKTLSVGIFPCGPLANFRLTDLKDDDNAGVMASSAGGLYVEMMNRVAAKHGLRVRYVVLKNVGESIPAIKSGKVDAVLSIFQTPWRTRFVDFCALTHSFTVGGVSLASDKEVRTVADLHKPNVRIVVCAGEVGQEYISHDLGIADNRVTVVNTDEIWRVGSFVELGQANIAITDSMSCKDYIDSRKGRPPKLRHVFKANPLMICPNGIMIPQKQRSFGAWLDREFSEVREVIEVRRIESVALRPYRGIVRRI